MNKLQNENELLELYIKVEPIIENLLNSLKKTNIYHYNLIVSQLNNLQDDIKQSDRNMISRLNFLKDKKNSQIIEFNNSPFSSGELTYLNDVLND